jgi:hypothetical protein
MKVPVLYSKLVCQAAHEVLSEGVSGLLGRAIVDKSREKKEAPVFALVG